MTMTARSHEPGNAVRRVQHALTIFDAVEIEAPAPEFVERDPTEDEIADAVAAAPTSEAAWQVIGASPAEVARHREAIASARERIGNGITALDGWRKATPDKPLPKSWVGAFVDAAAALLDAEIGLTLAQHGAQTDDLPTYVVRAAYRVRGEFIDDKEVIDTVKVEEALVERHAQRGTLDDLTAACRALVRAAAAAKYR